MTRIGKKVAGFWQLAALLVTCLSALGATSCAGQSQLVSLKAPDKAYQPDDYKSVLRLWTRERRLNTLEEMDNVLTVTSTYYSAEFRAAYLAKYVSDYHLSAGQSKALVAEHAGLNADQHEFYVALFAQQHKYGLLDDPRSAFQVHLVDDQGRAFKPMRVEHIKRPGALETTYFPYSTSFRSVFRVVFDKKSAALAPDAKWFGLRFSGPQGTTVLTWRLREAT